MWVFVRVEWEAVKMGEIRRLGKEGGGGVVWEEPKEEEGDARHSCRQRSVNVGKSQPKISKARSIAKLQGDPSLMRGVFVKPSLIAVVSDEPIDVPQRAEVHKIRRHGWQART